MNHELTFDDTGKDDGSPRRIPRGARLVDELSGCDSIEFGCQRGLCGVCLVYVEAGLGALDPPSEQELETLEVLSTNPKARLACQLRMQGNLRLRYVGNTPVEDR